MKRKEDFDLPMWLEEGLCQLIQSEVHPSLQGYFTLDIAGKVTRYPVEELWNDLSSCKDVRTAYLQAYRETRGVYASYYLLNLAKIGIIVIYG
jgi:exoribonuclease R